MSFDNPLKRKHVMFDTEPAEHSFEASQHAEPEAGAERSVKAKKVRSLQETASIRFTLS
jgi:hypothetical protein